ncbi:MAG: hypothetical protein U0X75_11465 [Acidobacteriota bacterium]
MEDRFFAKHPDPAKQGVSISKAKYDVVRQAIVTALQNGKELTLKELFVAVSKPLQGKLDGSMKWYTTVVKLDLEARKVIERVPNAKPQRIRLR